MGNERKEFTCTRARADPQVIERMRRWWKQQHQRLEGQERFLRVISSPQRWGILLVLKEWGRVCVCDLSDILAIAPPAVSKHMSLLELAGLVTGERSGPTVWYSLTPRGQRVVEVIVQLLV